MIVTFVWIVIIVALAGLALWALGQFTSDPMIHKVARVVIVVVAVLLILGLAASLFGVNTGLPTLKP
jgi:hypothetical protein